MKFRFISDDPGLQSGDIVRCLTNIMNIPRGSIPLGRGIGLAWANLSQIPPDAENDIATDIIENIEQYEPRVSVSEVTFEYDSDGEMTAAVSIEKGVTFYDG